MELIADQWTMVETLGQWVENEAEFKGRTDSDFLVMFLRSCDFDVELSKKTMCFFYQNRLKYPVWWANRNLRNASTYDALRLKSATILINNSLADPLVVIVRLSNMTIDSKQIDELGKVASLIAEVGMRQLSCQLHGVMAIVDLHNYPTWIITHFLRPSRCLDMFKTFVRALPVRVKKLVFLNCTPVSLVAIRTLLFILPQSYNNLIQCFGSDLSKLSQVIPLELLPEEYGGSAGPLKKHEDAFIEQVLSFNDYFLEDTKFGYQQ